MVLEDGHPFLIQGAYDYHLKKIDAVTGKIVWEYQFDDVIKGTGTIWKNPSPVFFEHRYLILQGARRGYTNNLFSKHVPSFRAISLLTGRELWRMDIRRTHSYSRDTDGSALINNNIGCIGMENGTFIEFLPSPFHTQLRDNMIQPEILQEFTLYTQEDMARQGGNLVIESSPCKLGNRIYITAGSGHVYGYNIDTKEMDWDFFTGSDIDGSPVVTSDGCLLAAIEKQYIPGKGGVFKLDPSLPPDSAVIWFFPTENHLFASWEGGIIGSPSVNTLTRTENAPPMAAFTGIDGYLYVVDYTKIDTLQQKVPCPNLKNEHPVPVLLFKDRIGPSISTPLLIGDKLIAAGYHGLSLYQRTQDNHFELLDRISGRPFESTPFVYDEKIFIGSRDGYLYCFGNKPEKSLKTGEEK